MKEATITEYHCCSDCNYMIQIPCEHDTWEVGCLHSQGKPNTSGGLCRCDYFEGE